MADHARYTFYEPYPFVLQVQQLEPHLIGYIDRGSRMSSRAMPVLVGVIFVPFTLLFLVSAIASSRVSDRIALLGLAFGMGCIAWLLLWLNHRLRQLSRVFAYNDERDEVEIVQLRRSTLLRKAKCKLAEARFMIHKATFFAGSQGHSLSWGSGFVLAVHVGNECFVVAAQPSKEKIIDLWDRLPVWLRKMDAGEGPELDLYGDRALGQAGPQVRSLND